jgi:purine-binding chemotaxis protein CheW
MGMMERMKAAGTVVDSVSDGLEPDAKQIGRGPEFNSMLEARCIKGPGTVESPGGQRMLILVDIDKLMSGTDIGLVPPEAA